jgi:hypothetical protein
VVRLMNGFGRPAGMVRQARELQLEVSGSGKTAPSMTDSA